MHFQISPFPPSSSYWLRVVVHWPVQPEEDEEILDTAELLSQLAIQGGGGLAPGYKGGGRRENKCGTYQICNYPDPERYPGIAFFGGSESERFFLEIGFELDLPTCHIKKYFFVLILTGTGT